MVIEGWNNFRVRNIEGILFIVQNYIYNIRKHNKIIAIAMQRFLEQNICDFDAASGCPKLFKKSW